MKHFLPEHLKTKIIKTLQGEREHSPMKAADEDNFSLPSSVQSPSSWAPSRSIRWLQIFNCLFLLIIADEKPLNNK